MSKKLLQKPLEKLQQKLLRNQEGRVGYIIAWLLGVPVWVLVLIFLIRGH